jgi:hypothetical protein
MGYQSVAYYKYEVIFIVLFLYFLKNQIPMQVLLLLLLKKRALPPAPQKDLISKNDLHILPLH